MIPPFADANIRRGRFTCLGAYSLSMPTGVMAAGLAAGADIFHFRWTDPAKLCLIEAVEVEGLGAIVGFTAGIVRLSAFLARAWTVDGSGGTAATMTTNNAKARTGMATSLLGAARISSTAALVAGTRTLDAQPFGEVIAGAPATAGANILLPSPIYAPFSADSEYLTLGQNEGIVVQATVPATGTWTGGLSVRWLEVVAS